MPNLIILHENNDIIVVNKMAGLISEKSPFEALTVESQVEQHLLKTKRKPYIGVIHRLDRVTSGVLMFAKNKRTLVKFNEKFSNRSVHKTYLAIVKNKPAKDKATLINFLIKNHLDKRADIVDTKSKEALDCKLSYDVLGKSDHGYLLEVKPTTGRFHQIRAQLAHIGLPIIGDEKYGSDVPYQQLSICLHAWKLTYNASDSEKSLTFEAPVPEETIWKFDS